MFYSTLTSSIFLLAFLTASTFAVGHHRPERCPTITRSAPQPSCPLPTHFCPEPDCVILSEVSLPCHCPTVLPTETVYTTCTTGCHGDCSIDYKPTRHCSASHAPTTTTTTSPSETIHTITQPTQCQTITHTDGTGCSTPSCTSAPPDCTVTSTVVNPCGLGCTGIAEVTSCATQCRTGCSTSYQEEYLPCPMSPPSPTNPATAK